MLEPAWLCAALTPPRAFGPALAAGRLRAAPEDFIVEEDLGFAPDGAGAHVLLRVRKRASNTQWVARELARLAGCRPAEVGFAGLKDRHSLALQWFSVPRAAREVRSWPGVRGEGFEVLEAHGHARKLPRGALAGNRFRIRVRDWVGDAGALGARLQAVKARGVPNYFGPQRFGREASNLRRLAGLEAPGPAARRILGRDHEFVLSAARSLIFNAVLAERVRAGSWEQLEAGDLANLDGRGSIFPVETVDEVLTARARRLEIHPTGPLWGEGEPQSGGAVAALETRVAAELEAARALTAGAGLAQERRSLRLAVRDLEYEIGAGELELAFALSRGSYATTVLAELIEVAPGVGD